MNFDMQIAIDGPSGAGKSSVAKTVAKKMGIIYVDTGALYRTVGYYIKEQGIAPTDAENVVEQLPNINIEMKYVDNEQVVYLNGVNLGDAIRQPEISMYASAVSAIPEVRAFLLNTQRDIAKSNSVIMDGRDIGTVILPDADVKIFLTASLENRAQRRYDELSAKGICVNFDDVLREMEERDANDSGRSVAPAVAAKDAIILDNTGFTVEQSSDAVMEIIKGKLGSI